MYTTELGPNHQYRLLVKHVLSEVIFSANNDLLAMLTYYLRPVEMLVSVNPEVYFVDSNV